MAKKETTAQLSEIASSLQKLRSELDNSPDIFGYINNRYCIPPKQEELALYERELEHYVTNITMLYNKTTLLLRKVEDNPSTYEAVFLTYLKNKNSHALYPERHRHFLQLYNNSIYHESTDVLNTKESIQRTMLQIGFGATILLLALMMATGVLFPLALFLIDTPQQIANKATEIGRNAKFKHYENQQLSEINQSEEEQLNQSIWQVSKAYNACTKGNINFQKMIQETKEKILEPCADDSNIQASARANSALNEEPKKLQSRLAELSFLNGANDPKEEKEAFSPACWSSTGI